MNFAEASAIFPGYQRAQQQGQDIQLQRLRMQAVEQELEQARRAMAAQGIAFDTLSADPSQAIPGATPMPPGAMQAQAGPQPQGSDIQIQPLPPIQPQGAPVPLRPAPQPGFVPQQPQPQPAPAGPLPAASASPAPMAPGGPPAAPGTPGGGGAPMPGGLDIPTLAKTIKQRNPGIDNPTLFQAVIQASNVLMPEAKQNLAILLQQFKQASADQKLQMQLLFKEADITSREKMANLMDQTRLIVAGMVGGRQDKRSGQQLDRALANNGLPPMPGASDDEKLAALGQEKKTEKDAKLDPDLKAFNEATKAANALNSDITKLMPLGSPPEVGSADRAAYDQLMKQKNQYRADADAAYKRLRGKGQAQPYDDMAEKAKGTVEEPEADPRSTYEKYAPTVLGGKAKPLPAALLKDLPDPKKHPEGSKAKDSTGKVVAVIKGGAWAAP